MNVQQLRKFCQQLPHASERLLEPPYNILVYELDDRFFAYFKTSNPEMWRFSIKVAPERFLELTDIPGVKPARYRGRYHWITIVEVNSFPAAYLRELVEWSHQHAFRRLRVSRRKALLARQAASAVGTPGH
jgi:predicted DNA-binding protein (MmcQ/YjbR family)